MIVHRTGQGEMLDLICYRYYGPAPGVVELVLDVNRGLADRGPILPAGMLILLPRVFAAQAGAATIKLWD